MFVHDWGESRIDALARARLLLDIADRFVFYDLRGHGDADSNASRLGHDEHLDLLALIERIGSEAQPSIIIGRGLGAVIAMRAAIHTQSIAGIIAIKPYYDFHAWLRSHLYAQRLPARPMTDLLMLWLRMTGRTPPDAKRMKSLPACSMLMLDDEPDATTAREFIHRAADHAHHRASRPASEAAAT